MQAGLLRDWIEIQQETVERDQLGGETREWVTILRTRARISEGRESGGGVYRSKKRIHPIQTRHYP